jgi:hypothetical protein
MKNNRYFLIIMAIATIFVWSRIYLQIADAVEENPSGEIPDHKTVIDKKTSSVESDLLLLNYEDPFLKKNISARQIAIKSSKVEKKPTRLELSLPSGIRYHGVLKNESRTNIALVFVNDRFLHVTKNQRIGGFEVFYISRDTIGMRSGRSTFYLKRHSG